MKNGTMEASSSDDDERRCWVCCEAEGELLETGCACRGSAGLAHTSCLVSAAKHNVNIWNSCPTCKQFFTGEMDLALSRARWELVRDRPAEDKERMFVANNLAVTLHESLGANDEALRLMEEVLAVRRRTLGDEDPSTLDSLINLALQHLEMGAHEAALPLNEEAVAATRRTLGDEHEHTLVAVGSLAALHNSMGQYAQARPLHEEVLVGRLRALGPGHVDTMNALHGLGQCLCGLGEEEDGLARLREAVSTAQRVLGPTHPSTRHFVRSLESAHQELRSPES